MHSNPARQGGTKVVEPFVYFALHKPKGYVSTSDEHVERRRVVDLSPDILGRVYIIGWLDADSTGLMILTNDGDLASRLTHPRFSLERTYQVLITSSRGPEELSEVTVISEGVKLELRTRSRGPVSISKLTKGIWLGHNKVRAKRARIIGRQGQANVLELVMQERVLAEGKEHVIRRMLSKLGYNVMSLKQVAVGPITLGELPVGESRRLSTQEVDLLQKAVASVVESVARVTDPESPHLTPPDEQQLRLPGKTEVLPPLAGDNYPTSADDTTIKSERIEPQPPRVEHHPMPDQKAQEGHTQRGDGFQNGMLILVPTVEARTASDLPTERADIIAPKHAPAYNNLLHWLSAAGIGRWDAFLRTCQLLGLAQDAQQARRVIRRLGLLGHITLCDDGVRWTMQPPTLTPLLLEPEQIVLRGQRTPAVLTCLPDNRQEIPQPGGPDRVSCCLPLEEGRPTISIGGISFRVEQCILARAQRLPEWRVWAESLRPFDGRDLGKFARTERWDGLNWVGTPLYFDQPTQRIVGPGGLYRLSQEVSAQSPLTVCFDAERQRIVRGDWYGLRFLAGHLSGAHLGAEWDRGGCKLFVPLEERWPFLYEQMLVQASGLLPNRSERPGWLCYLGVPKELAECLRGRLDVKERLSKPMGSSTSRPDSPRSNEGSPAGISTTVSGRSRCEGDQGHHLQIIVKDQQAQLNYPSDHSTASGFSLGEQEVFEMLAIEANLSKDQIIKLCKCLNEMIREDLSERGPGRFLIPGIAMIKVVHRSPVNSKDTPDPKTGRMSRLIAKPARNVVKVLPLKSLKLLINPVED
jgi:23S rRNA pseudouridine2605 synthase